MKNTKPLPNKVIKLEKKAKAPLKSKGGASSPLSPLTPKEKAVLDFIEEQILSSGISPSYQEIKEHFQLASFNSVQNYLKQLMEKGYVYNPPHQKRALQILHTSRAFQDAMVQKSAAASAPSNVTSISKPPRDQLLQARGEVFSLPLLGRVAAGVPIERVQANEHMLVPAAFVKKPHSSFLLKVEGDSMIEDGIFEGDVLIVESAANADNGATVVAMIDHEATVKRFYNHGKNARASSSENPIELRPANARLKPMWFKPDEVEIKGVVVGLMRAF